MHVFLLAPDFPPARGGVQVVAARLAEAIELSSLTVVTTAGRGSEGDPPGMRVRRMRDLSSFGKRLRLLAYNAFALAELFRRRPAAVLVTHVVAVPAAVIYRRLTGRSFVVVLHGQEVPNRPWLTRLAVRQSTAAVAVSRHTREMAIEAGAPAQKVVVVNLGVDAPDEFVRAESARPTIVTIARMVDRYKGHDVMIDAVDLLRRELPSVRWVVVGDGPLLEGYRRRVNERDLDGNVEFTGAVTDAERDALLGSAHVFAMPSRIPAGGGGEGFGLVYLEAAARGIPCLAGDEGGARDAVRDGVTGVLVDPRSSTLVAESLHELLTNRELRERLGRQAREDAIARHWRAFTGPVLDLLGVQSARPLRVMAVSHTSAFGGAERSLVTQLLQESEEAGVEVMLAAPQGPLAIRAASAGIPVRTVSGFERSFRTRLWALPTAGLELLRAGRELSRLADRERAEILHANSVRAALICAAARPFGVPPVVTHVRDILPGGGIARIVGRVVRLTSERVVANSEFAAAAYRRASSGGRVDVVYNPVAPAGIAPEPGAGLAAPTRPLTLAVVAQITPWKGQDVAIRTLAAVRVKHPEARLVIAGSVKFEGGSRFANEQFEADLHELASALGVAHAVEFAGEVENVASVLERSDIVLLPSWEEPFGRAAVEAMAAGRAVVATSCGGPREFIEDGVNGMLAAPGVVEEWTRAVELLAAEPLLRAVIGVRAAQTAEHRFAAGSSETAIAGIHMELA